MTWTEYGGADAVCGDFARLLNEKKGCDIVALDLRRVNSYLEFFIIATGNSRIHCRALAREIESFADVRGVRCRNKPDYESEWVVLDFDEIVIHIFTKEVRDYYQLEKLWRDADRIPWEEGA